MARQRAASGFNTKMLLENGCCEGSGLYMTENAFLTDKCWLDMTPNVIRGYRNMPYIKENKDWWMMEIVRSSPNISGRNHMHMPSQNSWEP